MIIEARLPKSWSEVPLKKAMELESALKSAGENPYNINAVTISVLSDIPLSEVRQWPVSVLNSTDLYEALKFVTKEPEKRMPSERLTLNGKKYDVYLYPQRWTAGMWMDFTTSAKMENDVKKMARMIACFTVPAGMKYGEGYEFEKVVDEINDNMDIETALGMTSFFQLTLASFVKALLLYSERETKKLKSTRGQASRSSRRQAGKDTPRNGRRS